MSGELIERLRAGVPNASGDPAIYVANVALADEAMEDAAVEITRLRAELSSGEADVIGRLVGALNDTQATLSAVKAEATVDGGGTCVWIAETLHAQMVTIAATLASLPDTVLPRPRRNASPSEVKTGRQGIGEV